MRKADRHDAGTASAAEKPSLGIGDSSIRTDDGRYIVVRGRRWRATNPAIPQPLERELTAELMAARRAVQGAKSDAAAMRAARRRVNNAKIALGERGQPWWDEPSDQALEIRIRAAIRTLLGARGTGKTICPSDVARIVGSPDWRPLMDRVRAVGAEMARRDEVIVSAGGRAVVDVLDARGPIRYSAGPFFQG